MRRRLVLFGVFSLLPILSFTMMGQSDDRKTLREPDGLNLRLGSTIGDIEKQYRLEPLSNDEAQKEESRNSTVYNLTPGDTTIRSTRLELWNMKVRATLTFLPFIMSSSVMTLTALDFLGFGLPPGSPSLGELLSQGKANVQAPWLGLTGFFAVALMLSLLIFVGEAVRNAFDPRKTFR